MYQLRRCMILCGVICMAVGSAAQAALHGEVGKFLPVLCTNCKLAGNPGLAQTPWHWAIRNNHESCVAALAHSAEQCTRINDLDWSGKTPLACVLPEDKHEHRAHFVPILATVEGINFKQFLNEYGATVFLLAAQLRSPQVLQALLGIEQVDAQVTDALGHNALHYAVRGQSKENIRLLAGRQSRFNAVNAADKVWGCTPLHNAVMHVLRAADAAQPDVTQSQACLQALLDPQNKTINVMLRDRKGRTPGALTMLLDPGNPHVVKGLTDAQVQARKTIRQLLQAYVASSGDHTAEVVEGQERAVVPLG